VLTLEWRRHVDDASDQLGVKVVRCLGVDPVELLAGHVIARHQLGFCAGARSDA
jgi:hypothetical protein